MISHGDLAGQLEEVPAVTNARPAAQLCPLTPSHPRLLHSVAGDSSKFN